MDKNNFELNVTVPELGVTESWQALFLLPSGYTDLSRLVTDFSKLRRGVALIRGRVESIQKLDKDRNPTKDFRAPLLRMQITDGKITVPCESFQPNAWRLIQADDTVTLYCVVKDFPNTGIVLTSPEREHCRPEPRADYKGIVGKVAGDRVMVSAFAAVSDPEAVRQASQWLVSDRPQLARLIAKHWGSCESLFYALHTPQSMRQGVEALDIARRVCAAEIRLASRMVRKGLSSITAKPELRAAVWEAICAQKETFSSGQLNALKAAMPALCGDKASRILVSGDTGSGKTLVFLCIAAGFCKLGMKCAILTPNGTVARQTFDNAKRRFPHIPMRYVAEGVNEGDEDAMIWIGTTGLLFAEDMPTIACLVVDEQHKFSKQQRETLLAPGTHLIEVSATPIPRTLASALFADCINAEIPTPPVDRTIRSHLMMSEGDRSLISDLHRQAIARGKRVVYLYAAVKKGKAKLPKAPAEPVTGLKAKAPKAPKPPAEDVRDLEAAFEALNRAFPGKVAMLHGQMPSKKAAEQLALFASGEMPTLVTTTSIEVGVDVPGIALLVSNDPDRFGMTQLHQFRGRIARDGGAGDFVMYSKKALSKHSLERLKCVRDTRNGFDLAERDLEMRGFGDVAGDMQTGIAETTFKLSQLTHKDFIVKSKEQDARQIRPIQAAQWQRPSFSP